MTSSHYCEPCDIAWPYATAYRTCPGCSLATVIAPGIPSTMTWPEAEQKAADLTLARQRREEFADFILKREGPEFRAELDAFAGVPE